MDETGAKVRGRETQRLCQGSQPVGPFPFGLLRLISGLGVSPLPTPPWALEIPFLGLVGFCLCHPRPYIFVSTFQIPDEFDNGE